jgi:hypothetical protein
MRLGRFAPRQIFKRAAGHRPQPFLRNISFFRALHEFLSDVLSAFMVAAVRQTPADFLKHDFHVRGCPLFDFGHLTPRSIVDPNQLLDVAIRFRGLQRNHGLNIECHAAQVGGQSIEEVALPYVGRKLADEGAILGIGQQLFEPCLQVFHGNTSRAPYTARRSGEMSCE